MANQSIYKVFLHPFPVMFINVKRGGELCTEGWGIWGEGDDSSKGKKGQPQIWQLWMKMNWESLPHNYFSLHTYFSF